MNKQSSRSAWVVSVSLALLVAACSAEDPAKQVASAKSYLARGESQAAIIQLKNAIQQAPDMAEARYLLATALLASGDAMGAEAELRKIRSGGPDHAAVTALLAESLLLQDQHKKVLAEFGGSRVAQANGNPGLLAVLAEASVRDGQMEQAKAMTSAALKAQPDLAQALIIQANFQVAEGHHEAALATLDQVTQKAGKRYLAGARKFKGDILAQHLNQPEQSMAAYRLAIEADPSLLDAHAGIIRAHLNAGRYDEAGQALTGLTKQAANAPVTLYLSARLSLARKQYAEARDTCQRLVKALPDNGMALELAGLVEYEAGVVATAEPFLAKAIKADPERAVARRLLMLLLARSGQLDKAQALIPEDLEKVKDPDMLSAAARVVMLQGQSAQAQKLFERAASLDPADAGKRTAVALTKLQGGQVDEGLADLHRIASSDQGMSADLALVNAFLQRGEFAKALTALDRVDAKKQDDPIPSLLRAQVHVLRRDPAAARVALDAALSRSAVFFPAVKAHVALDIAEGELQAAEKRVQAFLSRNPQSTPAMLTLFDVRTLLRAPKADLLALLNKAVEQAPEDVQSRVALVKYFLAEGRAKEALNAGQAALAALPQDPSVLEALGQAQMAAGEHQQALSTFSRLTNLNPRSAQAQLRLAEALSNAQDFKAAAAALRKALELQPGYLDAHRGLAELAVKRNAMAEALDQAHEVQKLRPREALGYLMEGDLLTRSGKRADAIKAYRMAAEKEPQATVVSMRLYDALVSAGASDEAGKLATARLSKYPKDLTFQLFMADRSMQAGRLAQAEALYKGVLAQQPQSVMALNNLAWIAGQQGRKEALALIERAAVASPENPEVLDTWADLLLTFEQPQRALDMQTKATQLSPEDPRFKLTMAKILLKLGKKDAAKEQLKAIRAQGSKFPRQKEVDALLQGL